MRWLATDASAAHLNISTRRQGPAARGRLWACSDSPSSDGEWSMACFRAGRVRLGHGVLRPARSSCRPLGKRAGWSLALVSDGGHGALPRRSRRGREPAGALSPAWRCGRDRDGRALPCRRHVRLGRRRRRRGNSSSQHRVSGAGWSAMSAAALNAIVSPWFVRARPAALAMAYNGGSIGGIIFSPLWVAAIATSGSRSRRRSIGLAVVLTPVVSRRPACCPGRRRQ